MSSGEPILTRDELAALLGEPGFAPRTRVPDTSVVQRPRPFDRVLERFADEQSRIASTQYQRAIRFNPLRTAPVPVAEFAASLIEEDRVFLLSFGSGRGVGALVIGRPLLFGWLAMAFGAPDGIPSPVPVREYTRIERRFMSRLGGEITERLGICLRELADVDCRLGQLTEPALIEDLCTPRLVATAFDVEGLGEPGRLRIALPAAWVEHVDRGTPVQQEKTQLDAAQLYDVPLDVHVEIGSAELPLRRVTALRPGDVVLLDATAGGDATVRIEGEPRFKATRGTRGGVAAVQIEREIS